VLIDAGISLRDLSRRMAGAGLTIDSVDAVIISHGHSDHVNGVAVLCRRRGIPVFANKGTAREAQVFGGVPEGLSRRFTTGRAFDVGTLTVAPFPVPHDAAEPVGFVITDGRVKVGYATDLGSVTLDVLSAFNECDAAVIESNHDEVMLREGPYPEVLKKRVRGPRGHLSNDDAAELLRGITHRGLRHVALAHLSRTNNRPEIPLETAGRALMSCDPRPEICVGWQEKASALLRVG
jgi:phosphoribosyl 1,2-cyclic phosphodiesterase